MVCNGICVIDGLGWIGSGILSCRWVGLGWVGLKKWWVALVSVTKTGPTAMSGWTATDRRWNKNVVSQGSVVAWVKHLPIDCTNWHSFVSRATAKNSWVRLSELYLILFLSFCVYLITYLFTTRRDDASGLGPNVSHTALPQFETGNGKPCVVKRYQTLLTLGWRYRHTYLI